MCLIWHIFLWQSAPMVALATDEDEVMELICFFCCECWDCFPCWEEGICAVQLAAQNLRGAKAALPHIPSSILALQECHQDSCFPGCSCFQSLIREAADLAP